jgi:hypothetical protein
MEDSTAAGKWLFSILIELHCLHNMAATSLMIDRFEVYTNLRTLGCCKRCCLRYLGERDPSSYKDVDETLIKVSLAFLFLLLT